MERKSEICKAGQQYLDSMDEFQRYHTYPKDAFIDGAKWADEHPKPGMVNKQEFIEKLEKWIRYNTDWTDEYIWDGRNPNYGLWNELVKYLEE